MKIIYSKKGTALSDFEAFEVLAKHIKSNKDLHISTSNVLMLCRYLPKVECEFENEVIIENKYVENLAYIPDYLDNPTCSMDELLFDLRTLSDFLRRNKNIFSEPNKNYLVSKDYNSLPRIRTANPKIDVFYDISCESQSDFDIEKTFWNHYKSGKDIKTSNRTMIEYIRFLNELGYIDSLSLPLSSNSVEVNFGVRTVKSHKKIYEYLDYHLDYPIMGIVDMALEFGHEKQSSYTIAELEEYYFKHKMRLYKNF